MLAMVTAYHNVHLRAKTLRGQEITQALRFVLADRDVDVAYLRNLREPLQRMQQNRLARNLGKLLRGLPRTSARVRGHARAQSRRGNDDDHSHGKRSIEQSGDRVIG